MAFPLAIIPALGSLFGNWIKGRQAKQIIKINGRNQIEKAKIEAEVKRIEKEVEASADWDNLVIEQQRYTWRDEWLVGLLSYPFLVSFTAPFLDIWLPEDLKVTPRITEAWQAVAEAPEWYQFSFVGVVIATFGLRWWVNKKSPFTEKSK